MRLVRLDDLSEEERKKALEKQQARLESNRQANEQARQNANDRFNELVSRTGGNDTSKHTTSINEIVRTMKNSGASKERISTFKKNNHATLWDSVLNTMNGIGKVGENTWLGLNNGIKSFQQTLGRRITETQTSRANFWNEQNKEVLEKIKKEHPEEKEKIEKAINNPLISGEKIREEETTTTTEIQNKINNNTEKINKNIEEIDNPVLKRIAEISPSIGQMVPSFVPGAGAVYAAGSATGQYYNDAKQRGMTDEEANMYSGIMGLVEGGTEMIGVKNLSKAGKGIKTLVKGTGKEVAKETTEQVSKSVLKNALKDYGIGIADNVIQEALIDPIDEVVSYGVSGKTKYDYSTVEGWKQLGNDMLQDGINGGLVSAILGGANLGIQSCTGVVQKYKNNQTITENEFKTAVKDAGKKLDVQKMVVSGVEQQVNKYKDYYSNKPVDSETQSWLNQAENIIDKNKEVNVSNNQMINNNISQQDHINTSNMTFEDSAKAYNIDANNEAIKTVNQALSNREISGRFDSSYFNNNNENAIWRTYTDENGKIKREVIFNPNGNSQDTIQQISIHELTHDLAGTQEFEELKSLVINRNKTMQGYAEARQSLENTYSQVYDPNSKEFKSLVDDEEVADTLAQKLGDQDFVNSLSTEKPTVFKRIYDWVVDKVNKITGNKIEKVYWEDIKSKFENAYRQTYQGETNQTKYSFVGQRGLNNAIQQEPMTYMTIERRLNRAKQMQKAGIDNENIRQNTDWFQDKNGDWKFEISDRGMSIKDNIKKNSSNKLGNILNHNTLFTMYPELSEIKVEFKESKGISGNYNRNSNTITLSNNLIGNNEKLEKTIIHEIQHAIQTKEGFETGITSKLSKKAYYENLGEIEAEDVSKRFINEKYNNKNLKNIAPESSKANPKHRYYDQYMKNRGTVDKIKDNVFKYPKKDGNSNEINQEGLEQIDKETLRDNDQQIWDGLNVPTKKLTDKQRQNRLEYLRNVDTSNMKFLEKHQIKSEIRALENGYNSVEEMRKAEKESRQEIANNNDITLQREAIANKLKDKGASVDKDGNVTLYHITTIDNYNQINKDGYFKPNDSPIGGMTGEEVGSRSFFTYDKDWVETWRQSADSKVIEVKVPAEYIRQGAKNEKEIYIEGTLKRRDNGIWTTDKLPTSTFYDRMAVKEYQKQKTSKLAEKESENNSGSFNLSKKQEVNKIKPDGSITMTYVRNPNNKTQDYGSRYGQNLEPAGEYMSMDTMQGKYKVPGFEYGTIDFKRPLVLEHKDTTANGWKKDLSEKYGGLTGKKLSNAIKKDGYDAIMTKDEDGNFVEIVNLNGQKNNNNVQNNRNNMEKSYKEKQLDIIQKSDPMLDDYHTGIRTVNDIKTFKEAYDIAKKEASDGGWDEYASYPDITNEMIENSLKTGNITVYSSNDIKNGTFVTPSYEQALEYAGNDSSKVKSKKVKVDDVAWINLDEGQYVKIDKNNNQSKLSIKQSNAWQEFLNNQIGQRGEGKTVQDLRLPTKETINNKKVDSYNVLYKDNEQMNTMNLLVSEGGKVRKHYKSIMQSSNTLPEAKAIAKELIGTDTYVPDSNERQLEIADDRIERNGADNEAVSLATKVKNGDKITATDIATGERLIEYYSKIGDREKLQDSIQNVALAGTQLGQAVQAMSLVNRQTPQGQAVYLQKVIDKMNSDIDRRTKGKGKKFELTPEMIEKITNSSKENLKTNIEEVARELANQVPKTTIEKIDSWRYFSMLANPRTHIRNIIGNLSMASVQTVKNKVAGGLEAIAQKTGMIDKRSKTLKPASKETRKFAKADVNNVLSRLNNESKFDTRNLIQQYQRTFKSNLLENTLGKLYNLNSKALEKEDIFGLKRAYRKSLADYMTANKLTESDLTAGTREADIQLEKARKYAIEQAQEATFHQQSAMASILNTFENKSTATRLITGAVIPFKKTPINVAKTGASYSPLGLVKSFTLDIANLRNGKITANQYIDNLAKGLTGTGIAAAGYALAQAGILSASGDDDDQKNQYYQEDRGNQPFSLKIGDKTYSLDWLAPTAIPLFIGAELNFNINNSNEEQTAEDILDRISNGIDAMSSAMNPMIEMSMLSGLASTIKSFSQGDTQVFQNLAINAGKSYINQFFPTLSGQIAKIVDDTERSTTSTKKNAFAKAVDSTGKQILNKIPFASQLLPAKTDVWGNTLKRDSNPFYRALQQTTFPWTEKNLKSTDVDNAISDLYEETGEKSVLPNTSINKDFTLNGEKYRLTAEEYAEYKKQYGKNSYNLLNGLTRSKEYKNMNNEQKTEAISKVYEYANEKNKVDYANKNKVEIETSSLYNTVTSIEEEGGKGSDYFKYLGEIMGIEKAEEKIKILEESDIPSKSKSSIYTNTVGKSDDFYSNVLKESNININEYLKYKQQKFESDRKDDGTLEGKTVTNSKKKKVYNYVNGMNITYNQKLLILGKQYKLSDSEQKKLYQYINSIPGQTSDEKLEIFKMYTNNFQIYKDGTMSLK